MINNSIYKQLISDKNIYNAIYSLESYVFEKELLNESDIELYNELLDKYNLDKIGTVIIECKKIIKSIFEKDEFFKIQVYFKPKKYNSDSNKVEFRPIHCADLKTQICIVAILNLLMFDDSDGKRKLSDLSKLLPSNYYGNLPSTNVEFLFKPWSKQYQEYSQSAIDAHRKYLNSKLYNHIVNLDIKQFYPSINPNVVLNIIIKNWPIDRLPDDHNFLKTLISKLLYFNIELSSDNLKLYYKVHNYESIAKHKLFYNIGLPQGLPQAYFFANLLMTVISKEIDNVFNGDSYYYVDDSIIYTNSSISAFNRNISKLNKVINLKLTELENDLFEDSRIVKFNEFLDYQIKIHGPESHKSYITSIKPSFPLYALAKPASTLSFEIYTSVDEIEDSTLKEKSESILSLITLYIKNFNQNENEKHNETLKLLYRYKKFYTNRLNILKLRDDNNIDEGRIEEFYAKYGLLDEFTKSCFFERIEDDVFAIESKLLITNLSSKPESLKGLFDVISGFEHSYSQGLILNHYYSKVLKDYKKFDVNHNLLRYYSLSKIVKDNIDSFSKISHKAKIEYLYLILSYFNSDSNGYKSNEHFKVIDNVTIFKKNYCKFIYRNSNEFIRKILNSIISRIIDVPLNDSVNFFKNDNRQTLYYELRLLMIVRSKHFNIFRFKELTYQILNDLSNSYNLEKVDLSLHEVLPIFHNYVANLQHLDNLILVHKYVKGIWKNGSKFLHFYTLHNEEHSIELIRNCIKISKTIDYLKLSSSDFYILFLACYLHDISMAIYPNMVEFSNNEVKSDLIYSRWKKQISEFENIETEPKTEIKKFILEYYKIVNEYFETNIRNSHAWQSASYILKGNDLSFIEIPIRKIVAEISESHGYETRDVYQLKSEAKDDAFSEKYLMIMLRLADLLDLSKDRVSIDLLNKNIDNMPEISKFHWISHLATDSCSIRSIYPKIENLDEQIEELIVIDLYLNTKQLSSLKSKKCSNLSCILDKKKNSRSVLKIEINQGSQCKSDCNFTCRWLQKKHFYLFNELIELQKYLKRNPNNIFNTKIQVLAHLENSTTISSKYFDIIKKSIETDA